MSLSQILAATLNPATQVQAEQQLNEFAQQDFGQYLKLLSDEVVNTSNNITVRLSAGLALKNSISGKTVKTQEIAANRWLSINEPIRNDIKSNIVVIFADNDRKAGYVAAQIIQAIASIELPRQIWPTIITDLLSSTNNTDNINLKISTLQCLGLICEVVDENILSKNSSEILSTVVSQMDKENQIDVRMAALNALINSLDFIDRHFQVEVERNYILEVIIQAISGESSDMKKLALNCLNSIIEIYYIYLNEFLLTDTPSKLLFECMKSDDEDIVLSSIEFWSTIAELEANNALEYEETGNNSIPQYHFIKRYTNNIVEALLWLMQKKDDDDDDDEWSISSSAANCLTLIALVSKNDIVNPVLTFVTANINNEDWRLRDASLMAFGSIINGPDRNSLLSLVTDGMSSVMSLMKDSSNQVRESSAWVIGRVCEYLKPLITQDTLPALLTTIVGGLQDPSSRVASCSTWSLMNLLQTFDTVGDTNSSLLSQYFSDLLTALDTVVNNHPDDPNFRSSVYEAISTLILYSADDVNNVVDSYSQVILKRLQDTLNTSNQLVSQDDYRRHGELIGSLCYVISAIIRRKGPSIRSESDTIVSLLLLILKSPYLVSSTAVNDVFLTIEALIDSLGPDFKNYTEPIIPFIFEALKKVEDHQLCLIAVGLVGALCRALENNVSIYCENIMKQLIENLQSPELHEEVKPAVITAFGDIALALGIEFEKYLATIIFVLQSVYKTFDSVDGDSPQYDLACDMFTSIAETYIQIVQGFSGAGRIDILEQYISTILEFIEIVGKLKVLTPEVFLTSIGLIGDLAQSLPKGKYQSFFSSKVVNEMLESAKANSHTFDPKTTDWAINQVLSQR